MDQFANFTLNETTISAPECVKCATEVTRANDAHHTIETQGRHVEKREMFAKQCEQVAWLSAGLALALC